MALSPLNINQFSKLRPFLKSEFCGPHKNDKNTYAMCFGGPEIVKKKSGQSISGHPVYIKTRLISIESQPKEIVSLLLMCCG